MVDHTASGNDSGFCEGDLEQWPCSFERMKRMHDAACARADDYSSRVIVAERERDAAIHDRQQAERRLGEWISQQMTNSGVPGVLLEAQGTNAEREERIRQEVRAASFWMCTYAFLLGGMFGAAILSVLIVAGWMSSHHVGGFA